MVKEGDKVKVKFLGMDERGKVRLSMKVVDQETGEDITEKAGTDKSKILMANIWLTDMGTFQEMNAVWDGWVAPGHTPARATVEAKLAAPQYKVEIAVIAAR